MLSSILFFVSSFFFYVSALPLQKDEQTILSSPQVDLKPYVIPSTPINSYMLSNSLTDYYESIVDQVMETTIDDIISSAPHSYTLLYPDHVNDCQASLCPFIHALRDHLNFMRANLIASVRPLVDSNLPALPLKMTSSTNNNKYKTKNDDHLASTAHAIASQLTETLTVLNQRMSIQLGLIVNAKEAADIIIRQSVPFTNSEKQQPRHRRRRIRLTISSSSSFTTSWNSDESDYYNERQQSDATKAMTEWLHLWLSEIESILYAQFDDRIQDVSQSIMEDFLIED
ncbi:uncharacterized protein BX664DRAFT_360838 [Halteromyces radiatus]|uniref:uncharacterized protein n=1 Tax=Halteromyces radiatus TaxID=101107 RepID=UPI00221FA3E8|nr:uncharacterized protein BX664DRAFT_360838 [Halteromyces radiatus]KAI8085048.1 hypothetical protein BX664DRAFT_360838 [Halteromyces radiatus]